MMTCRSHAAKANLTVIKVLVALVLALINGPGYSDGLRVAVAAEASDARAPVSKIAARAPYILIFDTGGNLLESHQNPFAAASGDAGPPLANWLAERQVGTFVAGNFGAKLSQAMKEKSIRGKLASGSATAAVKAVAP
jgi:predicted Fe-Mo cluster-binding NifX family protein